MVQNCEILALKMRQKNRFCRIATSLSWQLWIMAVRVRKTVHELQYNDIYPVSW